MAMAIAIRCRYVTSAAVSSKCLKPIVRMLAPQVVRGVRGGSLGGRRADKMSRKEVEMCWFSYCWLS